MKDKNLTIQTEDFVDAKSQLNLYSLEHPKSVCALPRNFDSAKSPSDYLYDGDLDTFRKILGEAGVSLEQIESKNTNQSSIIEKNYDLILPTIFLTAALLTENYATVRVISEAILNYAMEHFKGNPSEPTVKISVVVRKTQSKTYKKIKFHGPASDVKDALEMAREFANDSNS